MANPKAYVEEITSLKDEIKRLNEYIKKLREQKKTTEGYLYTYMKNNNIEKYENITIKSITPRVSKPRKPEKLKREDAVNLFEESGISDPEEFWLKFKETQKYPDEESKETSEKKSKSKDDYDPFLGF